MPLRRDTQQTSIQGAQWDLAHNEFMLGVGVGRVCLCLSMQFLIFVKIRSKSLAPWGVCSLPGASGASSGPGALATVRPPASPPPHPSVHRALSTVPKLPFCLPFCLIVPSSGGVYTGWKAPCMGQGCSFKPLAWPAKWPPLCTEGFTCGFPHQSQS